MTFNKLGFFEYKAKWPVCTICRLEFLRSNKYFDEGVQVYKLSRFVLKRLQKAEIQVLQQKLISVKSTTNLKLCKSKDKTCRKVANFIRSEIKVKVQGASHPANLVSLDFDSKDFDSKFSDSKFSESKDFDSSNSKPKIRSKLEILQDKKALIESMMLGLAPHLQELYAKSIKRLESEIQDLNQRFKI